jgi:ACS family tartrate transporter-like MFS transporter
MPYLFALYVVNFLDRMNVGVAAFQMPKDLGFSDRTVGLRAGVFFSVLPPGDTWGFDR